MLHELPHVQISRKVATETLVFIDFAQQSTIFTAWERSSWYNFNIFHPDLAIIRSFPGSISCMSCSTRYLGCTSCHLRTYRSSRDADWAISAKHMYPVPYLQMSCMSHMSCMSQGSCVETFWKNTKTMSQVHVTHACHIWTRIRTCSRTFLMQFGLVLLTPALSCFIHGSIRWYLSFDTPQVSPQSIVSQVFLVSLLSLSCPGPISVPICF